MTTPLSALDQAPVDLIREVSSEAISFYVDELSGIYLPEDFRTEHSDAFDVECWDPQNRLRGKFGRFIVRDAEQQDLEARTEYEDVLLMCTTIGVGALSRDGFFQSIRHHGFRSMVPEVLEGRGIDWKKVEIKPVDFGSTKIVVDDNQRASELQILGGSIDYGRADTAGRFKTCELFERRLTDTSIEVANEEPEPREHQQILK